MEDLLQVDEEVVVLLGDEEGLVEAGAFDH